MAVPVEIHKETASTMKLLTNDAGFGIVSATQDSMTSHHQHTITFTSYRDMIIQIQSIHMANPMIQSYWFHHAKNLGCNWFGYTCNLMWDIKVWWTRHDTCQRLRSPAETTPTAPGTIPQKFFIKERIYAWKVSRLVHRRHYITAKVVDSNTNLPCLEVIPNKNFTNNSI